MGDIVQLWNPKNKGQGLKRTWVPFGGWIFIEGEAIDQVGILSFPEVQENRFQVRLEALGKSFEVWIEPEHDITIWIRGLEIVIIVSAVEGTTRMLVQFVVSSERFRFVVLDPPPISAQEGADTA